MVTNILIHTQYGCTADQGYRRIFRLIINNISDVIGHFKCLFQVQNGNHTPPF